MDVVKSVIIELRPLLRSCTVFLTVEHLVRQDHLKITIRPDCIVINFSQLLKRPIERCGTSRIPSLSRHDSTSSCDSYTDSEEETSYSKFMDMKPFCRLVPGSLSSFKIESNVVSFRILTEPNGTYSSGNIFNEVYSGISPGDCKIVQNGGTVKKMPQQTINVEKTVPVKLVCGNCLNNLMSDKDDDFTHFTRVLELPSENMDMSEWFCHGPSGEHHCHESTKELPKNQNSSKFNPGKSDLFHGLCFFIVSSEIFSNRFCEFNKKRIIVHCNRCLSCLGIKNGDGCLKFWNSYIKFDIKPSSNLSESKNLNLFSYSDPYSSSLALNDFLYTIKRLMHDSTLGMQMPTSCKILLECTIRSKKQYMLIWIMDRELEILKLSTDGEDIISHNDAVIKLKCGSTAKLLYKVEEEDCNEVQAWAVDVAVQSAQVSKDMFTEGHVHFTRSSDYIPSSSRFSNGFSVSYLCI